MKILLLLLIESVLISGEVRILTQNVWFDDKTGVSGRYAQLFEEINGCKADIICLQEVTPVAFTIIKQFASKNSLTIAGDITEGYGNVTLSRFPQLGIRVIPLPSRMGRKVVQSTVEYGGKTLRINNVHLDSMMEDTERRIMQLRAIIDLQTDQKFVIVGDCNFGDGDKENEVLLSLSDAGRQDGRATYDVANNQLAAETKFPDEPSRRLDRVIAPQGVKFTGYEVKVTRFSDHYRIMAVME